MAIQPWCWRARQGTDSAEPRRPRLCAKVLAIDTNPAAVEEPVGIIRREGGAAEALMCDVTSSTAFEAAVEAGVARFGQFDIMVNNVGGSHPGGAASMPEEVWEKQIAPISAAPS